MTFEIFISSAIISATITVIGNIVTAKMANKAAHKTAQETANKEIEKLKIELEHQDKIRFEDSIKELDAEYTEMVRAINYYIFMPTLNTQATAAEKVSNFMRHNIAPMTSTLIELLDTIDCTYSDSQHLQAILRPLLFTLNSLCDCIHRPADL